MLNYLAVHDPYFPPAGAARPWGKRGVAPMKSVAETFNHYPKPTPAELQYEMDQYDDSLLYVDSQIGALMQDLRRRGLDRNTLLIVTADHGEEFNEQGILTHANALYLEEIHVPLIVWDPGKVPSGVRIARPVSTADMGATALQIAGGTSSAPFPGRSLSAFWTNGDVEHWPYPIAELAALPIDRSFPNFFGPMQSIVTDQWHYVLGPGDREHLYACCKSSVDRADVSANSGSRPVMDVLKAELKNAGASSSPDARTASRLRQDP
jgi:arylsulfatase A-like enzyme